MKTKKEPTTTVSIRHTAKIISKVKKNYTGKKFQQKGREFLEGLANE